MQDENNGLISHLTHYSGDNFFFKKIAAHLEEYNKRKKIISSKFSKNNKDAVIITDLNWNVFYFNSNTKKIFANISEGKKITDFLELDKLIIRDDYGIVKFKKKKGTDFFKIYLSDISDSENVKVGRFILLEKISGETKSFSEFKKTYSNSEYACMVFDDKANILFANDSFLNLLRIKNKAMLYSKGIRLLHDNLSYAVKRFNSLKPGLKLKLDFPDRAVHLFVKNFFSIKRLNFLVLEDITDKVDKEQKINGIENRYKFLFNNIPNPVLILDENFKITEANQEFLSIFREEKKEIIGRTIKDLGFNVSEEDIAKSASDKSELKIKFSDEIGNGFFVLKAFSLENSIKSGYLVSLKDVTDMEYYKKKIIENNQILNYIVNSLQEGVLIIKESGEIVGLNKKFQDIFGYSDSFLKKEGVKILFPDTLSYMIYMEHINQAKEMLIPVSFEFRMKKNNGELFFARNTFTSFPFGGEKYIVISLRDLTLDKIIEQEIKEKEEKIKHTQKMDSIGRLISGIAHDLNNPLASIYGFAHLLLTDSGVSKEAKEDVKMIARSAEQAKYIVENLLRFVRKENSPIEEFGIKKALDSVFSLLNYQLKKSKVSNIDLSELKNYLVSARFGDVQQAFYNVILNAIEAMSEIKEEERRIKVSSYKRNGKVFVEFFNSGKTISEEISKKIFEPFYTTKDKGTGLGLSMVKQIMIEHGGSVYADCTEKNGAKFVFVFPESKSFLLNEKVKENLKKVIVKNKKILILDDDEKILCFLKKIFSKHNAVDCAQSVDEAKEKIINKNYDILIS
ncbi:MAG: PAS domain S-box protein, partial [Elusimicrobiales bacterium]